MQPQTIRTSAHFGESPLAEHQWQTMFDAMRDGVALLDREHHVVRCNIALRRLIGRPVEEIIGQDFCQVLHQSLVTPAECPAALAARSLQREVWRTVIRDRWFDIIADPVLEEADSVSGFVLVVTDVTDQKLAEDASRLSEARLRKVLEVETVGVMFWDLTDGTLVDANDTFLSMMGYTRRDVEERRLNWQTLTPPEFYEVSLAEVERFHKTGRVGPYEKEYLRKDGTRQWFVFAGSSLGENSCVEFCVDISARKKIEGALRESEQALRLANAQLRRFVDANMVGVIIAGASGKIYEANEYYLDLIGYSREEFDKGLVDWRTITPPEWLSSDETAIAELRQGGICKPYEKEYFRRDGSRVAVYLADAMLPGDDEQIAAFVVDITDRKIAETRIAASLQEKEVLLKEIHHRVKNNLQVISSLLQLQSNEVQDPGLSEKLRESQSRIHSMALIHERLYQSQNFASIAMEGYVRDLAASLIRSYRAMGVKLSLRISDITLPLDKAVPCGLILNELLTNAFKYGLQIPGQGEVEVGLTAGADGMVVLSVRDNGPGFSPGFDPEGSNSLGLLLVKMLAKQISGSAAFGREGGAVITVTFPSDPPLFQ